MENIKLPSACRSLADIREAIDVLDRRLVTLIGERAAYVRAAAQFKTGEAAVRAEDRVAAMMQHRRAWAEEAGVSPDMVEALFRGLVQHFIEEELHQWRESIPITPAAGEDLDAILALQKLAYQSEAQRYNDFTIPPLRQTPEEIRADFARMSPPKGVFLKAMSGERIVGSVRAYEQDGTCHIGRLIVHPDVRNRGIGTRLMRAVEQHFDAVQFFELFTGHRSDPALHLYHKLGYSEFKRQDMGTHTVVFLRKGV